MLQTPFGILAIIAPIALLLIIIISNNLVRRRNAKNKDKWNE
jgi:NADH:ubiquinone oxidoreductase subunit 3 (subunit A)